MIIAFDLGWFCDLGLWVLPRPRQPKEHDDATTTELH